MYEIYLDNWSVTNHGLKEVMLQMRNKHHKWNYEQGKHCQEYLELVNAVGINLP